MKLRELFEDGQQLLNYIRVSVDIKVYNAAAFKEIVEMLKELRELKNVSVVFNRWTDDSSQQTYQLTLSAQQKQSFRIALKIIKSVWPTFVKIESGSGTTESAAVKFNVMTPEETKAVLEVFDPEDEDEDEDDLFHTVKLKNLSKEHWHGKWTIAKHVVDATTDKQFSDMMNEIDELDKSKHSIWHDWSVDSDTVYEINASAETKHSIEIMNRIIKSTIPQAHAFFAYNRDLYTSSYNWQQLS